MALLQRLKDFLMRRRVRSTFGEFIPEENLERILPEKAIATERMRSSTIDFVAVRVRENPPGEVPSRIRRLVVQAEKEGGYVASLVSSWALVCWGIPDSGHQQSESRRRYVGEIVAQMGSDIALVHGQREGFHGNIRGDRLFTHSVVLPDFSLIAARLSSLPYGQQVEI